MKYGFVIDNRKCIGCHACTTACKSENQVPVGVNRTWVKQVEKGVFPDTRRLFSVMRCNQCTDAPCVEICPVEALFYRDDGIVDFDKDRCIGCKSCMQACPYDALYIDPENHTAAKCNYCAHRIDLGLEPACVNVCPEHAIISGNMEDPESEISQLLATQEVKVRKPEKATNPNLFYIDADDSSLVSWKTEKSENYMWSSQDLGVGHFAKEAEKMAFSNPDIVQELLLKDNIATPKTKSIDHLINKNKPQRVYDSPDKGILWGWEVSAYVSTKAIAVGSFIVPFLASLIGIDVFETTAIWWAIGIGMLFLGLTGLLLVKDLDRPDRFLNVLFRPQWNSWLVRGGYAITGYGFFLFTSAISKYFDLDLIFSISSWITFIMALLVGVYTAFLFAQAKGRDFWQSPALPAHMIIHCLLGGGAVLLILNILMSKEIIPFQFLIWIVVAAIVLNLMTIIFEMATPHSTVDGKATVESIIKGRYRNTFWIGILLVGNLLPLVFILIYKANPMMAFISSIFILIGSYLMEKVWVESPQRITLS